MGRVEGEIPEPMKLDHGGKKKREKAERKSAAVPICKKAFFLFQVSV